MEPSGKWAANEKWRKENRKKVTRLFPYMGSAIRKGLPPFMKTIVCAQKSLYDTDSWKLILIATNQPHD